MALDSFCSIFMPYLVCKNDDGTVSVLNREYLDLGTAKEEIRRPPPSKYKMRFTNKQARMVAHDGGEWTGREYDSRSYWLYDDATRPWDSHAKWDRYAARLRRLAHLKVKPARAVTTVEWRDLPVISVDSPTMRLLTMEAPNGSRSVKVALHWPGHAGRPGRLELVENIMQKRSVAPADRIVAWMPLPDASS